MDRRTLDLLQILAGLRDDELSSQFSIVRGDGSALSEALFRWRDMMCPDTDSLTYDDEE